MAALLGACVLGIAGLGFLGGLFVGGDDSTAAPRSSAEAPERSASDAGRVREDGPRSSSARRAYRRGYARGLEAGAAGIFDGEPRLRAGGAFFVRIERGVGGRARIGRRVQIEQGKTYWLCAGGQRLCMRAGGS